MKEGLFVYGTLHPDRAPEEIKEVVKRLTPLGRGTVVGQLHDLGEYPALIVGGKRRERVPGAVFALPDDPAALQALDRYEEFQPADLENSLFVRLKRTVTLENGSRKRLWVYLYNQKLPQAS